MYFFLSFYLLVAHDIFMFELNVGNKFIHNSILRMESDNEPICVSFIIMIFFGIISHNRRV